MHANQLTASYDENLTSYEVSGLGADFNFADGHAYHAMPEVLSSVISGLPNSWQYASAHQVPVLEREFQGAFARLIGSQTLDKMRSFSISPTASNSIDIVAAYLHLHGKRVGLITPAFDNLYLLLRRRGVDVVPVPEDMLSDLHALTTHIEDTNIEAIFIVSPNNPTGFRLSEDEFRALCTLCETAGKILIVDLTFRFYSRRPYDEYRILSETGVTFFTIEDTGKTWPTLDMKASLLVYSEEIAHSARELYEEIYLCTSGFALRVFAQLFEMTALEGVEQCILAEAGRRREHVASVVAGSDFDLLASRGDAILPLAWIDCSRTGRNDLENVADLKSVGIAVLPGRFFFWDNPNARSNFIRLSLLRPDRTFKAGLEAIRSHLRVPA